MGGGKEEEEVGRERRRKKVKKEDELSGGEKKIEKGRGRDPFLAFWPDETPSMSIPSQTVQSREPRWRCDWLMMLTQISASTSPSTVVPQVSIYIPYLIHSRWNTLWKILSQIGLKYISLIGGLVYHQYLLFFSFLFLSVSFRGSWSTLLSLATVGAMSGLGWGPFFHPQADRS